MINSNSLTLINKMLECILSEFVVNKNNMSLGKHAAMQKCFNRIKARISTRKGFHTLVDYNATMKIVVKNVDNPDDHTPHYLITISESGTSFKVEEITYPDEPVKLSLIMDYGKEETDEQLY